MKNPTLIKLQEYGFLGGGEGSISEDQFNIYISQLKELYQKYFSKEYIEHNFSIPPSYKEFLMELSSFLFFGKRHSIYSLMSITG